MIDDENIIPVLLILLLTFTLASLIFTFMVLGYLRRRLFPSDPDPSPSPRTPRIESYPLIETDRDYWPSWVVLRSQNPRAVQKALGLARPATSIWLNEQAESHSPDRLFISSPVGPWILLFGPRLPTPDEDIDRCYRFLANLSRRLGETQYYCQNPVTYQHAWARLDQGVVIRGYAWYQETLWNQGSVSAAERQTGIKTYGYGESPELWAYGMEEIYRRNTEQVFQLAELWSVDPRAISRALLLKPGLSGDLARSGMY